MNSQTLKQSLADWVDPDVAAYYLAVALGIAPGGGWGEKKWVFWSANPLGDNLSRIVEILAEQGILEKD